MIVNAINKAVYTGNGQAVSFPINFTVHEEADVKVVLVAASGKEILLERDYFVDLLAGVVVYPGYAPGSEPPEDERPPVLPKGCKLVIYREAPATQEVDLGERWPFSILEKMSDKLTMLVQQLMEKMSRAIVFPVSEKFDAQLPSPVIPGAAIAINSDGTGLDYVVDLSDIIKDISTAAYDVPYEQSPSACYNPESKMLWFGVPRGREGLMGPVGPRGERGSIGPQGACGPEGPPGQAPFIDAIDCGGALQEQLIIVDAGGAADFL